MTISIAKLRQLLPINFEFTAEYIGFNPNPAVKTTKRKVKTNSSYQLITEMLDGPKTGHDIHLTWNGVSARHSDNGKDIILTHKHNKEDFVIFQNVIQC